MFFSARNNFLEKILPGNIFSWKIFFLGKISGIQFFWKTFFAAVRLMVTYPPGRLRHRAGPSLGARALQGALADRERELRFTFEINFADPLGARSVYRGGKQVTPPKTMY